MSNCIWVCSNYHVGPDQLADAAIFQPKCATPSVSAFRNAVNLGCKMVDLCWIIPIAQQLGGPHSDSQRST